MAQHRTLRQIGQAAGMAGGHATLESLAGACSVTVHAAAGWWYYGKTPRYPAVERVKDFLLCVTRENVKDSVRRAELEAAIHDLYRDAA